MKRKWPVLTSDEEAERFVEEADLTEYDLSQMVPVSYEFERKAVETYVDRELAIIEGIQRGVADVAAGRTVSHEEAMTTVQRAIDAASSKQA